MRSPDLAAPPPPTTPRPFPKVFYVANSVELFERLAFYGMYVNLSNYLTNVVGFSDVEGGRALGNFRLVATLAPILCGTLADRIGFKRSLVIAFSLYALGYSAIFGAPTRGLVLGALLLTGFAGGFMKPVITGTIVRTSPEGRQTDGFGVFYRMINSGSVVGKTLAYGVRRLLAMRFVMVTSVISSLVALGLAVFMYRDPEAEKGRSSKASSKPCAFSGRRWPIRGSSSSCWRRPDSTFWPSSFISRFQNTLPAISTRTRRSSSLP
jgi:dipeptide/tripeptide permease